ncbi:hypothetical protein OW763_13850 [Clostridium aestuarii]|uniref:Uncharacterized protein n=1 Tax=Clostridium aestuarii TaxID=338193 RepID=A0ABT4D2D7_9CLOT|nr:hypothetical protein [Clostridium aestuarii]MCY6485415.1 hypothetical protein [Clostridium aestuarii]
MYKLIIFILSSPMLGLFIYTFFNPKKSFLLGRKWMFDYDVDEDDVSDAVAIYNKIFSVVGSIIIIIAILRS